MIKPSISFFPGGNKLKQWGANQRARSRISNVKTLNDLRRGELFWMVDMGNFREKRKLRVLNTRALHLGCTFGRDCPPQMPGGPHLRVHREGEQPGEGEGGLEMDRGQGPTHLDVGSADDDRVSKQSLRRRSVAHLRRHLG